MRKCYLEKNLCFFYIYVWYMIVIIFLMEEKERKKIGREKLGKIVVFWGDERLIDR